MPDEYKEFELCTEVKRRIIHAPSFRDRILHHAIVQVIGDLLEHKFIANTYACIANRGSHKAAEKLHKMMRKGNNKYALQCDISKYFQNVDHDVLKRLIRKTIGDERLLEVLDKLIDGYSPGLPIGSLTSQLFANVYLGELDHYIKDRLRIKYYIRYMDDFVALSSDKQVLVDLLILVEKFITDNLKLQLNKRKTEIKPLSQGIDFVGFRMFKTHVLPRRRNVKAAKLRFRDIAYRYKHGEADFSEAREAVMSFMAYMQHCDGWKTAESRLHDFVLTKTNKELDIK